MDKHRKQRGQSLVELALVLPCFCLGVFTAVQLMCCCHNMVELQRMGQNMIDRVTYANYQSAKKYTRFNSLWGNFSAPWAYFDTQVVEPWRPFKGVSTISDPGRFFRVHVDSQLLPGAGFTSELSTVLEQGYADTFIEPPAPVEQ